MYVTRTACTPERAVTVTMQGMLVGAMQGLLVGAMLGLVSLTWMRDPVVAQGPATQHPQPRSTWPEDAWQPCSDPSGTALPYDGSKVPDCEELCGDNCFNDVMMKHMVFSTHSQSKTPETILALVPRL